VLRSEATSQSSKGEENPAVALLRPSVALAKEERRRVGYGRIPIPHRKRRGSSLCGLSEKWILGMTFFIPVLTAFWAYVMITIFKGGPVSARLLLYSS